MLFFTDNSIVEKEASKEQSPSDKSSNSPRDEMEELAHLKSQLSFFINDMDRTINNNSGAIQKKNAVTFQEDEPSELEIALQARRDKIASASAKPTTVNNSKKVNFVDLSEEPSCMLSKSINELSIIQEVPTPANINFTPLNVQITPVNANFSPEETGNKENKRLIINKDGNETMTTPVCSDSMMASTLLNTMGLESMMKTPTKLPAYFNPALTPVQETPLANEHDVALCYTQGKRLSLTTKKNKEILCDSIRQSARKKKKKLYSEEYLLY